MIHHEGNYFKATGEMFVYLCTHLSSKPYPREKVGSWKPTLLNNIDVSYAGIYFLKFMFKDKYYWFMDSVIILSITMAKMKLAYQRFSTKKGKCASKISNFLGILWLLAQTASFSKQQNLFIQYELIVT